jgi:rifampicin phosphotransferase
MAGPTLTSTMPPHVLFLSAAAATEVSLAGGKGAMLARLLQSGLPIPPGCVITPQALTDYLDAQSAASPITAETADRILRHDAIPTALQDELHTILAQIPPSPHGWAVRSSTVAEDSATASFAGIYDSYLNISNDDLWEAVCACWRSWWSDRAMAYRQRMDDTPIAPAMAVVVQHMVSAVSAGVAFTVDPISRDPNRMVIHAAPELGDMVVSGAVEPEQYILTKTPEVQVVDIHLIHPNQPPLLDAERVACLGRLLQQIETLCKHPQDVEWAWDGKDIHIVQSRPITTLGVQSGDDPPDVWTNANLKDVIPGLISPLAWSLTRQELEIAFREQYARVGYTWSADRTVMRQFWGRAYFNISLFQRANYDLFGAPPALQASQLGGSDIQTFTPPHAPSLCQRLRWMRNNLMIVRFLNRVRKQVPTRFAEIHQRWTQALQRIPHLDRTTLIDEMSVRQTLDHPFLVLHLDVSWGMSGYFAMLRQLVAQHLPQAPPGFISDLVTGLGDVHSAEHSYRLWELSRLARQSPAVMAFLQRRDWSAWPQALSDTPLAAPWQAFLDTYGHRGLYEVDMANPRWREQPDYLFDVLASYAAIAQETPPFDPQAQAQRRQQAATYALQNLPWWRRSWFRNNLHRAQEYSQLREHSKSHLVRLIDVGRQFALRAGELLAQDGVLEAPDDVFFLEREELIEALRGEISTATIQRRIEQRRRERQRYAALQPPEALIGDQPVYDDCLPQDGLVLSGLPSSPGRVTGTARVLRSPQEGARLQAGDILVAPSTDPGWTPLFLLAAGLVMETGGYLSHGAIVAREYGIPAVINVSRATQRIADGATITLDGGAGTVQLATEEMHQTG